MKKILLILFIIGISAVIYFWYFQYNKKHVDVQTAKADTTLSAIGMLEDARNNITTPIDFDKKYLTNDGKAKVVQLTGVIDKIELKDSISNIIFGLDSLGLIISIEMLANENEEVKKLISGQNIEVKALYVGMVEPDEMMEIPGTVLLKKGSIKK